VIQQVLVLQLKVVAVEHTLVQPQQLMVDQVVVVVMDVDRIVTQELQRNLLNQVYQEFLVLDLEVVDQQDQVLRQLIFKVVAEVLAVMVIPQLLLQEEVVVLLEVVVVEKM
tara:strand:- start:91 stop:423 length:333 start_codon:yes stop_codon:yes gene_type:complete